MKNERYFATTLLEWNKLINKRQMPWKGEKDPYKIWISEIILQQTRVQQGTEYYNRFINAFPCITSLATAPEIEVYKLWEGLGYYSRCKNLLATAKYIHENYSGIFPDQYEDILSLKGIGPYTASAIASFAFNLPHAVLDGNVFRVLSRFFGCEIEINTTKGKQFYSILAGKLLDKNDPGQYNQAIMDFGAMVCKPAQPLCFECPLQKKCVAFLKNQVAFLPVNKKIIRQRDRFFNYLVIENGESIYIRKRTEKDIWQNLYEFILIETDSYLSREEIIVNEQILSLLNFTQFEVRSISKMQRHKLTHQTIYGRFIHVKIQQPFVSTDYFSVNKKELMKQPFPKFITSYLTDKNVSLNSFSTEENIVLCGVSIK
ncbi:MAG: A/G-specific adenine glycosylase [Ginsengibacter sp.]